MTAKINQLLSEYRPGATVEIARLVCTEIVIRHGVKFLGKSEYDAEFVRQCEAVARSAVAESLENGTFWRHYGGL
jgi:hypothetical protein